ncbi:MAG TPA: RtcB family protein [Actinomycetota bacterium]|nr:RtcB family protein [Actinomycetota bacterium]
MTLARPDTSIPRIFAGDESPPDAAALAALMRGVRDADLAAPPVVLPDFLHKPRMEMPSSIAVATRGTIRPAFTASSLNCGMTLLALDGGTAGPEDVVRFLSETRAAHPWPPGLNRTLGTGDVIAAATLGTEFAVDRYGLPATARARTEEGGRLDLDRFGGPAALRREIPWLTRVLSGMRFAAVGPSNHFIELQRVEAVLDPPAARALGLSEGGLTIQFHGGGGVLPGQIGRLYARRRKAPTTVRMTMALQKPGHHLCSARSIEQVRRRFALYFREGAAIPLDGVEGRRVMLAHAAAMNFGFAFRGAVAASLAALARRTLGAPAVRPVVDSPHNSIYEEDGAIVHRHNACRAWPAQRFEPGSPFAHTGQALLLPGTARTSSYVCVAGSGADASLYSACHGSGGIVADFISRGLSRPDPRPRATLRMRYDGRGPQAAGHYDDRGVDEALSILTRHDIARPVARLRPLGVLH